MEIPGHALTHKTKMFYNKVLATSKTEYQATKHLAFKWFHSWKAYQNTVPGKTYAQALAMGKQCTHTSYVSPTKSQALCSNNQKNFTKFKNQAVYPNSKIQSAKLQSVVQNTTPKEHTPTVHRLLTGGSVTRGSSTEVVDHVLLQNRFQPLQNYEEYTSKDNQGSYTDQVTATKIQLKVNTKEKGKFDPRGRFHERT